MVGLCGEKKDDNVSELSSNTYYRFSCRSKFFRISFWSIGMKKCTIAISPAGIPAPMLYRVIFITGIYLPEGRLSGQVFFNNIFSGKYFILEKWKIVCEDILKNHGKPFIFHRSVQSLFRGCSADMATHPLHGPHATSPRSLSLPDIFSEITSYLTFLMTNDCGIHCMHYVCRMRLQKPRNEKLNKKAETLIKCGNRLCF